MPNLGPKMPYFGIFGLGFEKTVWNHHPQICLTANFVKKQKCLNLQPKMYDSGIFKLEFEKNTVIFVFSTLESV